jgi:hypothetical protein
VGQYLVHSIVGIVSIVGTWTILSVFVQYKEARQETVEENSFGPRLAARHALSLSWSDHLAKRSSDLAIASSKLSTVSTVYHPKDKIIVFVLRDFIHTWYSTISNDSSFLDHIQLQLSQAFTDLIRRVRLTSPQYIVFEQLAPLMISHLVEFRRAEQLVRGTEEDRVLTESQELNELIASKYSQGKRLHSCLHLKGSTQASELVYLRKLADQLLSILLPDSNDFKSPVTRTLVREIIASVILKPVVDLISDPYFWNNLLDQLVYI